MSTQNISNFVELSGGVNTVYVVVFFVLRVILSLRCIRMSTKQGKMNLTWNHILSTLKTLENRRTHKIESDYFHKSVGKWRDLLILRMWARRKGKKVKFFQQICNVIFTYKGHNKLKTLIGYWNQINHSLLRKIAKDWWNIVK